MLERPVLLPIGTTLYRPQFPAGWQDGRAVRPRRSPQVPAISSSRIERQTTCRGADPGPTTPLRAAVEYLVDPSHARDGGRKPAGRDGEQHDVSDFVCLVT